MRASRGASRGSSAASSSTGARTTAWREIAYGVEEASQGQGYATEAVAACLRGRSAEQGVEAVQAATFAWHVPSLRVIGKVGMTRVGTRDHETMGEMVVFESGAAAP